MKVPPGIYKRGNVWWITYMLAAQQVFESSRSRDIRDAIALLRNRKTEIAEGRVVISHSKVPLFSDALQTYILQIENPNTAKRYQLSAKVLIYQVGDRPIDDLTPFMFDKFKEARILSGVTPAGVNRELALARAALNLAVERRLIGYSPFAGVKLFDELKDRRPPKILSLAEEDTLLSLCDFRLGTLVRTLLETGIRVGIEALPLKWTEIDFEDGVIRIVRSKTAAGRRLIPMTTLCKSELLRWRASTVGISQYVFFNPQRPATHIRSVKTAWHNALRAAGISAFPIYQCRHTFATRLSAAGVPDATIDQLLGHARRDVLSHYTVAVPEYLRDAISQLDELRRSKQAAVSADDEKWCRFATLTKGSTLIQ